MRIFVTGASGFVGSAVVQELLGAGHEVIGLARSDESAKALIVAGASVHMGSIYDLDSLRHGAANADGVIHTAFDHDFSKFKESCEQDKRVIEALGENLIGSKRPLIITSGIGILPKDQLVTEETMPRSGQFEHPRSATEIAAGEMAERSVNVSIVRLPPSVHGDGDHGFIPILINMARQKGISVYAGEGQNHWPAVHRLDAARVFKLAIEKGIAGAKYHAVAEEGIAFKDIAEVIAKRLGVPLVSKPTEEASEHFGWFAHFAEMDIRASSQKTQEILGWKPTKIGLLADIDSGKYFQQ